MAGKGAVATDFLSNIRDYLQGLLRNSDVYLIFDRYFETSIKNQTRSDRSHGVTGRYTLSVGTELPPQKAVLAVTDNKKQLIQLIVDD